MIIIKLAWMSLVHRRASVCLTLMALTLSSSLLLGINRLWQGVEQSFSSVLSGADLIVATKGSPIEILLYSIFQLGMPSEPLSHRTYLDIRNHPEVAWTIPLALGDSHKSFRVIGTTDDFLRHYRYGRDRSIALRAGQWFVEPADVVLGSQVAEELGYTLGDRIIISHEGEGSISLHHHSDQPFRVSGILKATQTPFDQALFIGLTSFYSLHHHHGSGHQTQTASKPHVPTPDGHQHATHQHDGHQHDGHQHDSKKHDHLAASPQHDHDSTLSSIIVKMRSRFALFQMQEWVRNYPYAPLTAILPALTLTELWSRLGFIEKGLKVMGTFSSIIAFLVLLVSILSSLQDRRREIAIYRAIGATPGFVGLILFTEAMLLSLLGTLFGLSLSTLVLALGQSWIVANVSLQEIPILPSMTDAYILLGAVVAGGLFALLPAVRAYRVTLQDGLTPQV